ncbi:hypothetical protein L1987_13642 [Smallanthus sonchifolius]|uniref:Uncharacterized protein n=1 Tax=Smallanthus sonchifolius TaxID=185202 RepID=A0ACB9JJ55_9ASTR|nr:hypothetical protein L1987_13642 [Smallanthus sonchifolius]
MEFSARAGSRHRAVLRGFRLRAPVHPRSCRQTQASGIEPPRAIRFCLTRSGGKASWFSGEDVPPYARFSFKGVPRQPNPATTRDLTKVEMRRNTPCMEEKNANTPGRRFTGQEMVRDGGSPVKGWCGMTSHRPRGDAVRRTRQELAQEFGNYSLGGAGV